MKKFKTSTASSNLSYHLEKEHGIKARLVGSIKNYITAGPSTICKMGHKEKKTKLCNEIALWFSLDLIPFEKCSTPGFQRFLSCYKIVKDLSEIPTPRAVATGRLDRLYHSLSDQVKAFIPKKMTDHSRYRHTSLTTDHSTLPLS